MKFTIRDRSPGASFSRLRFATELPTTKATADKLSSILAKRSNGVLEYWSTGISRRDQLHPLRRIENGSSGAPGRCPLSIPALDAGASARIS